MMKKEILIVLMLGCVVGANASEKQTSRVTKHCYNGRCFLAHSLKTTSNNSSSMSLTGEHYNLNEDTPIIIKNKNDDIEILSGKELRQDKEMNNYFPTECFMPEEFYVTYIDPSKENYIVTKEPVLTVSDNLVPAKHTVKYTKHSKKFYVLEERKSDTEGYATVDCNAFKKEIVKYLATQKK
ncbi:MAG TPA: hypothetical protein VKU36_00970 [Candidatus Babeliales bacterium]|nr:hypothetical protein [Candidatus Babeliales bacterium]